MRVQAQILDECVIVPCRVEDSVQDVAKRALERLNKLKPGTSGDAFSTVRKLIGNVPLNLQSSVGNQLKKNDFIIIDTINNETEEEKEEKCQQQMALAKVEIAKIEAMKKKINVDYGALDFKGNFSPASARVLTITGDSLTSGDLAACERGECRLELSPEAIDNINKGRAMLDRIVDEQKTVYGVTTGFGTFCNVLIPPEKIKKMQINLIRSHAIGFGDPLPPDRVRVLLALRINVLAKGYSGVCLENINKLIAAFNEFCVPFIPQKGTVGCSGDLAPLAHLALGLMGEGKMWSPSTGWLPADVVLRKHGLEKLELGPKEGLALINGTQMVTALGALALERADNISKQADVIAALSLDVLKGTTRAFDPDIHRIRPHPGQQLSAFRLRSLLHSELNPSAIAESHRNCNKVQDSYTLRCVPQVHGIVHDTINFVREIIATEINSATDNPLVFAERGEVICGGNFHGEYPAKALDYLAIAVHELSQMSERRLERLVNKELSGLPMFLTPDGGFNSGYMIIQVCAASLVSENKVLCHPSSVDSIPTSCNQEDHVSMGGFAARKALTIVEHVEAVLAMELMAACQGLEFLKPLITTEPLNKVYELVRTVSKPLKEDRYMKPDVDAIIRLLRENKVWEAVSEHIEKHEMIESFNPDALRQGAQTPTGIVRDRMHRFFEDDADYESSDSGQTDEDA